jgi:transposase
MSVYIGIDWSEDKHDVVFLDEKGTIMAQLQMSHSPEGMLNLEKTRDHIGVSVSECWVGLETAHNLLIDYLWSRGYPQVYVIPPSVIKSCRGRYGSSGARTDVSDGRLIADVVRTDRRRLQRWQPDRVETRQIGAKLSLINHLGRNSVRLSNRLRAVLLRYYPAAVDLFSSLTVPTALYFLQSYPTPQSAAELTFAQFEAFARQHGHRRSKNLTQSFAHLQQPYPLATAETILVYQDEVPLLADLLLSTVMAKKQALADLKHLFSHHPDHHIFASLPGAGDLLAPALLAKFGDDRQRFPSPDGLQALAGTCPVTDQSGKRKIVKFRKACDRQFRHIVQQWARHSLHSSVWANAYWQQVRPRCRSDNQAYRILANRWLAIAWKLWQSQQPYDQDFHLQQRALRLKSDA